MADVPPIKAKEAQPPARQADVASAPPAKSLSAEEQAELSALEQEAAVQARIDAAVKAAESRADEKAVELAKAMIEQSQQAMLAANPHLRTPKGVVNPKLTRAPAVKKPGDIRVRAIRDLTNIRMGGRVYDFRVGDEAWMDPSHAQELSTGIHDDSTANAGGGNVNHTPYIARIG